MQGVLPENPQKISRGRVPYRHKRPPCIGTPITFNMSQKNKNSGLLGTPKLYNNMKGANKKRGRCWSGYKPAPGSTPYSKGSCVREAYKQLGFVIAEVYRREMSNRKATERAVKAYGQLKKARGEAAASKPGSEEQDVAFTRQKRAVAVYHGRLQQTSEAYKRLGFVLAEYALTPPDQSISNARATEGEARKKAKMAAQARKMNPKNPRYKKDYEDSIAAAEAARSKADKPMTHEK